MTCLRGQGDTIAPEASCSDFHWGEYERIDWQRVHQGPDPATRNCLSVVLRSPFYATYSASLIFKLRLITGLHAAGHQIASSYCVRKGLIRKAHLAHNLRKWNAKFPGGRLARAVPETLVMVLDDIDYFEEALSDVYEAGQTSSQHV